MSLLDNLVAYYKYNANANDSTANAYNWTAWGWISFSNAWKIDNCATFPWDNTQITYPDTLEAQLWWAFTYAAWFKFWTWFNMQRCCVWTWWKLNILIAFDSSANKLYMYRWNWSWTQWWEVSASISWLWTDRHHFAVTQTWTTVAMYKDGSALSSSGSIWQTWWVSNQTLQSWFYNNYWTYNWYLDEFWVWNRALSAAEVSALYNWWAWLAYPFSSFVPKIMMF